MKSFTIHTNSSKHSKRNKHRRHNAMMNSISRDKLPSQIFSVKDRIQNYENVEQSNKNYCRIVGSSVGLELKYSKDFMPIYFASQQTNLPEIKLCREIMTLTPFDNEGQPQQNANSNNSKIVRNSSTLLARLAMNALAASETDINAILELVETIYNSIHEMLQDVNKKQQMYKPPQSIEPEHKHIQAPKYVINIDLKRFIKYLNGQYIRKNKEIVTQNVVNHDMAVKVPYWKQPTISYPKNKCRSFSILLQPKRMSFNILVCKFNSCSMDFFQSLATFYNSCNMTFNTTKRKPVPSVFIRDWHFRNVSQGYLLSVLLKNNNVMSLNVMRKLYFVIITSVTQNLTIEINFKLTNGIFMAYDTPPFEKLPFEVIHWNDRHLNILESSSRILYTPALTNNNPWKDDDLNNDIQRDTKSDNTLHNNRSSSDSSSTLKYESTSEYEGSDYFRSTTVSACGFLDLKSTESSTDLTLRESVKTLTLSIDDMLSYHVLLNRKDCGDMNFSNTIQEQYRMCNSTMQRSRTWLSKIYKESRKFKTQVVMPYLNSIINETVFDEVTVSMEGYVETFTKHLMSQTFSRRVLKDLGSYLVKTIFLFIVHY